MKPEEAVFRRKWARNLCKNETFLLGEMTFSHDFVLDGLGDPYPVVSRGETCVETVSHHLYTVQGAVTRAIGELFPYATYEWQGTLRRGRAGFAFQWGEHTAAVTASREGYAFVFDGETAFLGHPAEDDRQVLVTLRPGAFDLYERINGAPVFIHTFPCPAFEEATRYDLFSRGEARLTVDGEAVFSKVAFCMDCGIAQADIRPICYEDGTPMTEDGRLYCTASVRTEEHAYQGVFSLVPGTAEVHLVGALFFDAGDGMWKNDVASCILYDRRESRWLLWVCSFSHDHILGYAAFDGDPRFGCNVVDLTLMEKDADAPLTAFVGQPGDEDPSLLYDPADGKWHLAICRIDRSAGTYRYVFFASDDPFTGFVYTGQGADGNETGGSFVNWDGERCFICGNGDIGHRSDYRIYTPRGMFAGRFDRPDGGFRGWGTVVAVKQASRTRRYWLTFDRQRASSFNWSYGTLYCFEMI